MNKFIQHLATASREALAAPVQHAAQKAIARTHATGRPTVGSDAEGHLMLFFPDGRSVPYTPDWESSSTQDE